MSCRVVAVFVVAHGSTRKVAKESRGAAQVLDIHEERAGR